MEDLKIGEIGVYYKSMFNLFKPESQWKDQSLDGLLTYQTKYFEPFEELVEEIKLSC